MKHQNERRKLQSDFKISQWWKPGSFYIFLSEQRKLKDFLNCHTTQSFNMLANFYVQNFTPTELENVLDSYFEHT